MNIENVFTELCMQFQIPPEQIYLYCLCTAHEKVVVSNFEVLSKFKLADVF